MKRFMFLSFAMAAFVLVSCNSNKKKDTTKVATNTETATEATSTQESTASSSDNNATEEAQSSAETTEESGQTYHLTGNDKMKYNKTELTAKAGEEITITMKNIGSLPAKAMSHDVVVLKPGSDYKKFGIAAAKAKELENLPEKYKKKMITHTKMLASGESDTITFTLDEPGTYPFLCSFPGHYISMNGTITVK